MNKGRSKISSSKVAGQKIPSVSFLGEVAATKVADIKSGRKHRSRLSSVKVAELFNTNLPMDMLTSSYEDKSQLESNGGDDNKPGRQVFTL